ncbi:MAG TPA: helix-turn-helix transcriptional regulator [Kribbella sp.]|jgi:DNA-binding CsgD family transcriptional regulator
MSTANLAHLMSPESTGWASLSPAERRVADLVVQGLTNRQIAELSNLSRHTVDFQLRQVFRKLDVHSRVHLARLAFQHAGELA